MKAVLLIIGICMSHFLFCCDHSIKVLIVGAGPSGLCVAKALQNKGIYPDIIERDSVIRSDGAGIAIPANGSWALNRIGIDISTKARVIRHMQFTDDQGEILVQERIDLLHPEGSPFYSIRRDVLMQQLLSSLDKNTTIKTSTTIKNFSEESDQIKVEFSDGSIRFYDWVIGCDGIHSSLRHKVHPNEPPEFLGLLVWRCVVDATDDLVMPIYMLGSDRLALLYPLPDNQMYVYGHIFQSLKPPLLLHLWMYFQRLGDGCHVLFK